MERHLFANADDLARSFADWLVQYVKDVLQKQDRFTIALSGGGTPKKLYRLLASDTYRDKIDWSRLHFFWGDERYVSPMDERNNARMCYDELLDHVPILHSQVHVMRTDIPAEESASEYEEVLHRYFDGQPHSFDLVLLGLGDNSHTLSLFPGYDVVHETKKWVTAFFLVEQNMYRITLTAPVVNDAAAIAYLVTGSDKASAVREVINGKPDPDKHPAQVIKPATGQVHWFLDQAAAADLN